MRIGRLRVRLIIDKADGSGESTHVRWGRHSLGGAGGRMMPGRGAISEKQSEHHCQREEGAGSGEEEGQLGPTNFYIYRAKGVAASGSDTKVQRSTMPL
jgi:hypothetical protein